MGVYEHGKWGVSVSAVVAWGHVRLAGPAGACVKASFFSRRVQLVSVWVCVWWSSGIGDGVYWERGGCGDGMGVMGRG